MVVCVCSGACSSVWVSVCLCQSAHLSWCFCICPSVNLYVSCLYVCLYASVSVCTYVCVYASVSLFVPVYVVLPVSLFVCACIICVCVCLCMFICLSVCVPKLLSVPHPRAADANFMHVVEFLSHEGLTSLLQLLRGDQTRSPTAADHLRLPPVGVGLVHDLLGRELGS